MLTLVSFERGTDFMFGEFLNNVDTGQFGGLMNFYTNPLRLHFANITFTTQSVSGLAQIGIKIVTLSERNSSPTVTSVGNLVSHYSIAANVSFNITSSSFAGVAPTFAIPVPVSPTTYGDLNGDTFFDLNDAQYLLLNRNSILSETQLLQADADLNGIVVFTDGIYLAQVKFGLRLFLTELEIRPADDPYSNCVLTITVIAKNAVGENVTSGFFLNGLFLSKDPNFFTEYDKTDLVNGSSKVVSTNSLPNDGRWFQFGTQNYKFIAQTGLNNIESTDIGLSLFAVYPALSGSIDQRTEFFTDLIQGSSVYDSFTDTVQYTSSLSATVQTTVSFSPVRIFDNTIPQTTCFNPNPPIFDQDLYPVTRPLSEDEPNNTIVEIVVATDLDLQSPNPSNINGIIKYSILSINTLTPAQYPVALDEDTGSLYIINSLDRESYARLDIVVLAIDQGPHLSSRKTATTTVQILNIADINDNSPTVDPYFQFNLTENVVTGTLVGQIIAFDADTQFLHQKLKYEFISGDYSKFSINIDTGAIITTDPIDADNGNPRGYNFLVRVNDQGTPQLSAFTNVTVLIIDLNDIPPAFIEPYFFSISEDASSGAVIGYVSAVDNDTSPIYSGFTYILSRVYPLDANGNRNSAIGDPSTLASINSTTGEVTLEGVS